MKIRTSNPSAGFIKRYFDQLIVNAFSKRRTKILIISSTLLLIIATIILFSRSNSASEYFKEFQKNIFIVENSNDKRSSRTDSIGFIALIKSNDFSRIYLSIADDAYSELTEEVKNSLSEMGSESIRDLRYRGAYAAVINNGSVVAEKLDNNGIVDLEYKDVHLKSSGYEYGSLSEISIRGKNFSPRHRGINVVCVDQSGYLKSFIFDFHSFSNPISAPTMIGSAPTELHNIRIIVDKKHYQKILAKRNEALKIGILLTSDDDYIPAKIKYGDSILDANIRLKGDWVDHLESERKWSYRINLKGESMLFGMSKFSIHHPKTRNYLGEWVFHQALKREGIIGLRYSFVNAELEIKDNNYDSLFDLGTYALEESFDKYLIENNNRREGVIVKINENLIWEGTAQAREAGLNAGLSAFQLSNTRNITILPFSQKKVLADSNLTQMFYVARNLYYNFLDGQVLTSEVFDVEKLATYNAISNLLGATHGLNLHNQRLYHNPITSRFEPIGFDGFAGVTLTNVQFYPKSSSDIEYLKAFAKALERISRAQYLDSLILSLDQIDRNLELLNMEFSDVTFDKEILYQNQKVIKKDLNPSTAFHAFLADVTDHSLYLRLRSISPFPIEILNISYKGQRVLAKSPESSILKPKKEQYITFTPQEYYKNLFVNKKSKKALFSKAEDVKDLVVTYRTYGTSEIRTQNIIPWDEKEDNFLKKEILLLNNSNHKEFDFLITDEQNKTITFKSGNRKLDHDLVLPKNYQVIAHKGLSLDIVSNAKIISYSPLEFKGSSEMPIRIFSSDNSGQGILVINTKGESSFEFVNFTNLSNPRQQNWNVTGAVNFYESPVKFKYVIFEKSRSEDALNIIRTSFKIENTLFRNIRSDAFDGDFVKGQISYVEFTSLGNDAIDISGSEIKINNVRILNAGDKALSAGENSTIIANDIQISNSEIAVASKDHSTIKIDRIQISGCSLGYTAFQKKSEFGPASIEILNAKGNEIGTPFLIETGSSMSFNNKPIPTQNNVIDKMYGNEYGKKSE